VHSILQADEFMGWNVTKRGYTFFYWMERILSWNDIAQKIVSFSLFIFVIPQLLDIIDTSSQRQARNVSSTSSTTTNPMNTVEEVEDKKNKDD
jgi:hypothetical protein